MRLWFSKHWRELVIGLLTLTLLLLSLSQVSLLVRLDRTEKDYNKTYKELLTTKKLLEEAQRNLELRPFENQKVMQTWVNAWVRNKIFSLTGLWEELTNIIHYLSTGSLLWGCDDLAEQMVRDARRDGYLVSECLVDSKGIVYGVKVSSIGNHVGCITCLDNYYWFIEPQTSRIVRIIGRD